MSIEVSSRLGQVAPAQAPGQTQDQVVQTSDGLSQERRLGARLVFVEEHIPAPMELTFDAPVAADHSQQTLGTGDRRRQAG